MRFKKKIPLKQLKLDYKKFSKRKLRFGGTETEVKPEVKKKEGFNWKKAAKIAAVTAAGVAVVGAAASQTKRGKAAIASSKEKWNKPSKNAIQANESHNLEQAWLKNNPGKKVGDYHTHIAMAHKTGQMVADSAKKSNHSQGAQDAAKIAATNAGISGKTHEEAHKIGEAAAIKHNNQQLQQQPHQSPQQQQSHQPAPEPLPPPLQSQPHQSPQQIREQKEIEQTERERLERVDRARIIEEKRKAAAAEAAGKAKQRMSNYDWKNPENNFGKKVKLSLKKMCKRYRVRLTVKRGSKRVSKSEKVLKSQLKNKMKKKSNNFGKFDFNEIKHKVKKFVKENKRAIKIVTGTAVVVGGSAAVLHKRNQKANKLKDEKLHAEKNKYDKDTIIMKNEISSLQDLNKAEKVLLQKEVEKVKLEKQKNELLEQKLNIKEQIAQNINKHSAESNSKLVLLQKKLEENSKKLLENELQLKEQQRKLEEAQAVVQVDVNANAQALEKAQMTARGTLGDYGMEEGASNLKTSLAATRIQAFVRGRQVRKDNLCESTKKEKDKYLEIFNSNIALDTFLKLYNEEYVDTLSDKLGKNCNPQEENSFQRKFVEDSETSPLMEKYRKATRTVAAVTKTQAHVRGFLERNRQRKAKMQLELTRQEPVNIREILTRQGYDPNILPGTDIGLNNKIHTTKILNLHPDKSGNNEEFQQYMSDRDILLNAGYKFGKVKLSLKKMCKRYHIRLTVKRGSKRVPKSEKVLKSQLKNKLKK